MGLLGDARCRAGAGQLCRFNQRHRKVSTLESGICLLRVVGQGLCLELEPEPEQTYIC